MPRPLRVTLIEFAPGGGLFQFAYQLGLGLAEHGHDVELLTGPAPEFPSHAGLRVVPGLSTWHPHHGSEQHRTLRKLRRGVRAVQLTLAWAQVLRYLRRRRPDLVLWGEWRFALDACGALLARRAVPRTTMLDLAHTPRPFSEQRRNGSLYKRGRLLEISLARAYAAMDGVLVLGERARQDMWDSFPGVRAVHVITHGDEGILAARPIPPPSSALPQALFFGTLARYKGIDRLIAAWPEVRRSLPAASLVIAGATTDIDGAELCRQAVEAGGVDVRLGYVSAHDVSTLFANARLLVAPYEIANTSGVIRLAHGFRRPVVVTDVGDLAAAVRDGETGLVVPPGDRAALVAALTRLLEDPQECDRQGAAGRAELDRTSSWRRVAEQVLTIWTESNARRP